jgi:peptidase E
MPKLYLLGGENVFRKSAKQVNQRAFQDAGEPLNVLVLPWARASFDNKYLRRKRLFDYFISLGAFAVNFVEYSDSAQTIAQKMADSRLVYLTGGVPSVLIERLKNTGVDDLLKNYKGVIVGRSAGALALCKRCVITCRSNSKVKIVDGIGLVDITLKVHYTQEKASILQKLSTQQNIYAVPEGSALIYDAGKFSAINKVYVFQNGKQQTLMESFLSKELANIKSGLNDNRC